MTGRVDMPAVASISAAGEVRAGTPLPVEERLDTLERAVGAIPDQINKARRAAVDEAAEASQKRVDAAVESMRQDVGKVAALLVGSLDGHRWAYASITLLLSGLIVQAGAGMLGNL